MGLRELLDEVGDHPGHILVRWRQIREEMHNERARTSEERGVLLGMYKSLMDFVETASGISPENFEAFKKACRQDYCLFLVREATVEGGDVDPVKLEAVTRREVEAGRMAPDDELRKLALAGQLVLGDTGGRRKPKEARWWWPW